MHCALTVRIRCACKKLIKVTTGGIFVKSQKPFGLDRYQRMRERNADYSRALSRTNLAVRCWLARVGDGYREDCGTPPRHRILAWLLANHIVQAFYHRTGMDVEPFSCGGMYGYGLSVGIKAESCNRKDIGETAWIACGSVRVDPKGGDIREYQLTEAILAGEDPLWAIDKAATVAIGAKWLERCQEPHCRHKQDADIYTTVYQIITLLLAMGYVKDAILGTFVDCSEYGCNDGAPKHPLRLAGLFQEPQFTEAYFEINLISDDYRKCFWIHRSSGALLFDGDRQIVSYQQWCGGEVERGLSWICDRLSK